MLHSTGEHSPHAREISSPLFEHSEVGLEDSMVVLFGIPRRNHHTVPSWASWYSCLVSPWLPFLSILTNFYYLLPFVSISVLTVARLCISQRGFDWLSPMITEKQQLFTCPLPISISSSQKKNLFSSRISCEIRLCFRDYILPLFWIQTLKADRTLLSLFLHSLGCPFIGLTVAFFL